MITRRSLFGVLAAAVAAPVVARYSSLMPVSVLPAEILSLTPEEFAGYYWKEIAIGFAITRQAVEDNLYGPKLLCFDPSPSMRQQKYV